MINDQSTDYSGKRFQWEHLEAEPAHVAWRWVQLGREDIAVPEAIRAELDALFLRDIAPRIVMELTPGERNRFETMLRAMGARRTQVVRIMGGGEGDYDEREPTDTLAGRTPFSDGALRDWFFASRTLPLGFPKVVSLMGRGPFSQADIEGFLRRFGVRVYAIDPTTTVLVLGREDWSKTRIDDLLDDCEDQPVRIYSQEMFLIHLASGLDPFDCSQIARRFKKGHPGLEFVASGWGTWVDPWTRAIGNNGEPVYRVDKSPLHVLGYKVGRTGRSENERREILRKAFTEDLHFVESCTYMAEWGENESSERLERMAYHLANMCRAALGNPNQFEAFKHWYSDRCWLKETFYRGHMKFTWPDDF